jgi:hypothetical protein
MRSSATRNLLVRSYKLRGEDVADAAIYRVIDCANGQWRATAAPRSSEAFPAYVRHNTSSELLKEECVKMDRRHDR